MVETQTDFVLGPAATIAGYAISAHKSVASTNAVAKQFAHDDGSDLLWVVASEQSAGRGRRGRLWVSEKGNLAASLLMRLPTASPHMPLLGYVAGIALLRTVFGFNHQGIEVAKLKWPNDLLWKGAKLAGILVEAETANSGEVIIVVGFGLNIVSAPRSTQNHKLPYATTFLAQMGIDVSAEVFFAALSDNWVDCFQMWHSETGRHQLLAEWRENAAGIGQIIRVERAGGDVRGIFETIDEHGRLIVDTGERVAIDAGDVYF